MSLELARIGECDTPLCEDDAETITPEGYVCSSCASEIAAEYDQASERNHTEQRASR
ncbi:hypothetical protein [Natrinema halophilum]|uniref:Uncharacterized protein n=1 Tax=Natrinema halophilum TaxID=1699371 RepID=A0A7D5GNP1_9EURY|nr:hypothetical protein [Natrinema halophilum]QLG51072.1 hypothetical protein HYG82_20675 [Natrinema halophilum]